MLVVGLGYKARHGKDTVAQTIISARSNQYDVRRYAFADELKKEYTVAVEARLDDGYVLEQAVRELCAMANQDCVERGLDFRVEYDPNPDMTDPLCPYGKQRTLLQWWGTEYRRHQNPFYWIKKLEAVIKRDQPQIALITDMRFPNEFYWVKNHMNGVVVKVERLGYDNGLTHSSERMLDGKKFDYEVMAPPFNLPELERDALELFDVMIQHCMPGPTPEQMQEWFSAIDAEEASEEPSHAGA